MAVVQNQCSAQFNVCNSTSAALNYILHWDVFGAVKGCYPQSVKSGQYITFEHCGAAGSVGAIAFHVETEGSFYVVMAWSCLPLVGNKVAAIMCGQKPELTVDFVNNLLLNASSSAVCKFNDFVASLKICAGASAKVEGSITVEN